MNTSTTLDEPILDDKTPALQPTPKVIAKSIQKINDFDNWLLNCIPPKPKVVNESLKSFKNVIKNCTTRQTLHFN